MAMDRKKRSLFAALLGILVSSACVVTIPVPGYSPAPMPATPELALPGQLQTQAAVLPTLTSTLTDVPQPTWTATETLTPFPTITPLPTLTSLPTASPLPLLEATLADLGIPVATLTQLAQAPVASGDPIGSQYACILGEKKPADLTIYPQKYSFTAWWDLTNAGLKKWNEDTVILSLVDGLRMAASRFVPLGVNVAPGETTRLKLEMITPKYPGAFLMTWGLRTKSSDRHFCYFTIYVIVK